MYSVKVECNFKDKNQMIDMFEYYDYFNQWVVVFEDELGFYVQGIYLYNINEFFFFRGLIV